MISMDSRSLRAALLAVFCLAGAARAADRPAVHGMLVVGHQKIYMSHLPMFHAPHDYQAIFQVELSAAGSDPKATYLKDSQTTGSKLYTFLPRPFVLAAAAAPGKSFTGDLYRGHFERGGTPIASEI